MIEEIKAIIFDLGNTLLYFDGDLDEIRKAAARALLQSLRCSGVNLSDEFDVAFLERLNFYHQKREYDQIEYPARFILHELLLSWSNIRLPEEVLRKALGEHYSISQKYWKSVSDMEYVLDTLNKWNYKLGIISNASDDADVQVLVDNAGIRDHFDIILTSAKAGVRKPNPYVFQMVLDRWGLTGKRVAMVGDTLSADIMGSKKIGMLSIWVTKHADMSVGSGNNLGMKPDFVISEIKELLTIFRKKNQGKIKN